MKSRVILLFVAPLSTTAVIVWLRLPGPDVPSPARSKPMEYEPVTSEPQSQQPALRSGLINPPRAVKPPTDNPTETADADTDQRSGEMSGKSDPNSMRSFNSVFAYCTS